MSDKKDKEMQDIVDCIITEFGYDKDNYIQYEFEEFCKRLSLQSFDDFMNNDTIVLNHYRIISNDSEFKLSFRFGYPKSSYVVKICENIDILGDLYSPMFYFITKTSLHYDLLPKYKELLRTRQIDLII